jgi:hypothetical protein
VFSAINSVSVLLTLGLWAVLAGVKVFTLIDALRYSANYYPAAGKKSRTLWLVILSLSLVVHLITWPNPIQFLSVAGTIGSLVYLFDVRPALQQVTGGGGGTRQGPYGPW